MQLLPLVQKGFAMQKIDLKLELGTLLCNTAKNAPDDLTFKAKGGHK
jgi:hypothetical protein